MLRLIERGLMYGNLVRIETPTLRDRYNAALKALIGHTTALDCFHIDLSGYSPEIGDELDDHKYLNRNGCNRQFILLTVEQKSCPLIGMHFTSSRSILCDFITDNYSELFALTARDAVIGELENSTYRIDDLDDLLAIRNIKVNVNTPRRLVPAALELGRHIEDFENGTTAWWDDGELKRMAKLAEQVGDIRRNPVVPQRLFYTNGNFYTTHFGGLYVLRNVEKPALISCDPEFKPGDTADLEHIRLADRTAVADFLAQNGLVEDVTGVDRLDGPSLLRQRLIFILIDHLSGLEDAPALEGIQDEDLSRIVPRHLDDLAPEFHLIADALKSLEQNLNTPRVDASRPGYFYLLRSTVHPDRELVNHLLAQLTPLDVLQLFICNKDLFYEHYRSWSDAKRNFVAEYLERNYMPDKDGTREALYGSPMGKETLMKMPWGPVPTER